MPRELLMQNSFAWTDAEGRLITADKALRCNARNLLVEGKTYQNLIDVGSLNPSHGYTIDKVNEIITYYEHNTANQFNTPLLKDNTSYTFICNVISVPSNIDTPIRINDTGNNYDLNILAFNPATPGLYKVKFTTRSGYEPLTMNFYSNTKNVGFSCNYPIILEGDFTNTDLPAYITGIESVAEREKTEANLYPINIIQSNCETDGIVLPNGVKNTIENGVHIKRVEKVVLDGTKTYLTGGWNNQINTIGFQIILTQRAYTTEYITKQVITNSIPSSPINGSFSSDKEEAQWCLSGGKEYIRFRILRSKLSSEDVAGVTAYLAEHPITVWYELATPITEPYAITEINMPIPLRSLPNGVCDTIEGNKIIQRVEQIVLDGSRNYSKHSNLSYNDMSLFYFVDGRVNKASHIGISSKLPCYDVAERTKCLNNQEECIILSDGSNGLVQIILKNTSLATQDVAGLKAYLKANPITLLYELATPIEHTIEQPIISIAKGSNLISTANNIQPNLKFKYKKATRKKPTPKPPKPPTTAYLYNAGNECTETTGGWNTQLTASYGAATTIVKNANNIYFPTGVWNMLLTNNKIDVTNYDIVYMKYSKEYISFNGHPARCAIKLGNENTSWTAFADDATTGALIGKDETENNVTNGILTIDVSNVTGSYYIGIGGQSNKITVHEVGLKKNNNSDTTTLYSNGNENEVLTGGYLTSSNNSATCNIEKQADNLYVNCTGKTSFDSSSK